MKLHFLTCDRIPETKVDIEGEKVIYRDNEKCLSHEYVTIPNDDK